MNPETKRAAIAAARRVVFAGLVILAVWLVLIALRAAIPASVIETLAESTGMSVETWNERVYESDWSTSFWTNEPVYERIGERLGTTARLVGLGGLISLAIAAVLLFIGEIIRRVTDRPEWLARLRQVLRLVVVSGGVSTPVFLAGTTFIFLTIINIGWELPEKFGAIATWSVIITSLLPVWLLVQAGHGERANQPDNISSLSLIRHLGIKLIIRLFRLIGVFLIVTVFIEQTMAQPGLGRLAFEALAQRDFPVSFAVIWVFAITVILVKLVADLIEIACNHFSKHASSTERKEDQAVRRLNIPRGWLIFCLVLVFISILVAIVGPFLAPYGFNEIILDDRLTPPSAQYLLGADNLGRDILSRMLYGIRLDVFAGLTCAGILVVLATGWATLVTYLRKANTWLGDTLEELAILPGEIIRAFPWAVLLMLLISMIVANYSHMTLVLICSLVLLPRAVEMLREAYRSPPEGKGWFFGILRAVPVMLIFTVAGTIFYISSLSYLGFGIPPPTPELGNMLSGTGRQYLVDAPWMLYWPYLCLLLLIFIWVMAGDVLLERFGFRSKALWAKALE